jgi:hypothetical protein
MRIPVIEGVIRRRLLVNYRADPEVVQRLLPPRLRPQLHGGQALVGICLIRLEQIRPRMFPAIVGLQSENAAHRFAVEWQEDGGQTRQGVFVTRRDTSLWLNHLAGGRIFPGVHHLARFDVADHGDGISLSMRSRDGEMAIDLSGQGSEIWPRDSVFDSLDDSSRFYEQGSLGYSVARNACRLDGLILKMHEWRVQPLKIHSVCSSYFDDARRFPPGSIAFDHALLMRNVPHEWHSAPQLSVGGACI